VLSGAGRRAGETVAQICRCDDVNHVDLGAGRDLLEASITNIFEAEPYQALLVRGMT
jgi:hypothetical protein